MKDRKEIIVWSIFGAICLAPLIVIHMVGTTNISLFESTRIIRLALSFGFGWSVGSIFQKLCG